MCSIASRIIPRCSDSTCVCSIAMIGGLAMSSQPITPKLKKLRSRLSFNIRRLKQSNAVERYGARYNLVSFAL